MAEAAQEAHMEEEAEVALTVEEAEEEVVEEAVAAVEVVHQEEDVEVLEEAEAVLVLELKFLFNLTLDLRESMSYVERTMPL